MDWSIILAWVQTVSPIVSYVLMALGGLVVLGATYVKLTPTQDDDAWFAKLEAIPILGTLLQALVAFSPFQRKE